MPRMWGRLYDVIWAMDFATALATNLRKRREDSGMNQRDFARVLGVSKSTLDRLENGSQNTTIKTLQTICKSLKCQINELLYEQN